MAQEISWSNLETDAGLASYLHSALHVNLYDPFDIRQTLDFKPFTPHVGSETIRVTKVAGGQVFAAATDELTGGASNANIGSGNFQLTVARQVLKWEISDLWRLVAPTGSIDIELLAAKISEAAGLRVTDMVTALFPSLATSVGSTTAQMKVDYAFDAQYKLNNARAPGPFFMVLAPHVHNKFVDSLRSEAGAMQYTAYTADQLKAKSPIFKGSWNGIEVLCSDSVSLDGGSTYRRNAMYAKGCFGYTEAPAVNVADAIAPHQQTIVNGTIRVMRVYDAANGLTSMYGDYYPAVVEQEDLRGVVINALAA